MRNLLIAAMLGSTALAGTALAQEATTTATDPAQPMDAASPAQGGFITWQAQDQMIASNLMGAAVYGAENETIGSVDDLLLDRDGEIIGVIVGIGGFLGIGERDVAIPLDQLDFVLTQDVEAAGGVPGAGPGAVQDPALAPQAGGMATDGTLAPATGATTTATGQTGIAATTTGGAGVVAPDGAGGMAGDGAGGMAADGAGGMTPGAAGTTATGIQTGTAEGMAGWGGSVIDHIKVNFTREQLEEAPPFQTVE